VARSSPFFPLSFFLRVHFPPLPPFFFITGSREGFVCINGGRGVVDKQESGGERKGDEPS